MIRLIQLAEKKRVDLNHWINHNPVGFPEQSLQPAPKGVIITIDHNYTRPTYPHSAVPFQSSKWLNFISVGIFYATQRKTSFHEILVTYGQTRRKHHPLSGHRYAHTQKKGNQYVLRNVVCCLNFIEQQIHWAHYHLLHGHSANTGSETKIHYIKYPFKTICSV